MITVDVGLCTLGEARARHTLGELLLIAGFPPAAGNAAVSVCYGYLKPTPPRPRVVIPYEATHVPREIPPDTFRDRGVDVPLLFLASPPRGEALVKSAGGHTLLARAGDEIRFGFDVASAADYYLNGRGEIGWPRDIYDRPLLSGAPSWRHDSAAVAVVNRYAELFAHALTLACGVAKVPPLRFKFWPGAAAFALGLSHDVDRLRAPSRLEVLRDWARRLAGKKATGHDLKAFIRGPTTYDPLPAIREAEAAVMGKSTFFVGAVRRGPLDFTYHCEEARRLLDSLRYGGNEVALHASYYSNGNSEALTRELSRLAKAYGGDVVGVRGHYLRLGGEPGWGTLSEAGFDYDASFGFAADVGWRGGASTPSRPFNAARDEPYDFVSIPMAVMDGTLFQHRGLDGEGSFRAALAVLDEAASTSGLVPLLWHYRAFRGGMFPAWGETYGRLIRESLARGAVALTHRDVGRRYRLCAGIRAIWSEEAGTVTLTLPPKPAGDVSFSAGDDWLVIPGEKARAVAGGFVVPAATPTAAVVCKRRK